MIGLFSLPGIVVAFPGGAAGQRLGERWAAMVGLSLMAIGAVVIALAPTFLMAMVGRIVSGIGGIIVNLAFSKMIAGWFAGKEMATAMGVMLMAWPVGMGLALLTLGFLAETHSWRIGIGTSALAAVVALASIVAIYRDPARSANGTSDVTMALIPVVADRTDSSRHGRSSLDGSQCFALRKFCSGRPRRGRLFGRPRRSHRQ